MENIEVEIRSFISPQKYGELLDFFKENAEFISDDNQETYYLQKIPAGDFLSQEPNRCLVHGFDAEQDLRIQRNSAYAKIWLKKGKLHDDQREEIEIRFNTDYFGALEKLFSSLGYGVNIKWFRKRIVFDWEGVSVMLDCTRGYGHILELEKMSAAENQEETLRLLKEKLQKLGIPLTPKEEFDKRFAYYKENWKSLTRETL